MYYLHHVVQLGHLPEQADSVGSLRLQIRTPVSTLTAGSKTLASLGGSIFGRPCVAGTQTNQHQANLPKILNSSVTGVHSDLVSVTGLSEMTHDSSGFGSLLNDQCNNSTTSTSYSKGTDRSYVNSYRWPARNYITLESDTSDIGLDRSNLSDQPRTQSPVERTDYPALGAAPKSTAPLRSTSSTTCPVTRQDSLSLSGVDSVYTSSGTSTLFPTSGRESRMLEENLASVARYVEELTGGTGSSGQKTKPEEIKLGSGSVINCGGEVYADLIRRPQLTHEQGQLQQQHKQQQQQQIQLSQLQQLHQQLSNLAAMKNEKSTNERDNIGAQPQELLLRLLASQFPDLVVNTSGPKPEVKADKINWPSFTGWESTSSGKTSPNQAIPRRMSAPYEYRMEQSDINRQRTNEQIFNANILPTASSTENSVTTELRSINSSSFTTPTGTRMMPEVEQTNLVSSPTVNNSQRPKQEQLDCRSAGFPVQNTPTYASTVAVLASLFGMGQTNQNTNTSGTVQTQQEINNATISALVNLLTSLQDYNGLNRNSVVHGNSSKISLDHNSAHEFVEANLSSSLGQHSSSCNLSEELTRLAAPYQRLLASLENDIDRAANVYRNSAGTVAQKSEAAYHWSGKLPVRIYRSMSFSRKVFLGGVPWDSTSEDLIIAFARFGNVMVSWPQQEGSHLGCITRNRSMSPKGYCYLIFEHESSVNELLAACARDPTTGGDYYKISSSKFKSKDVQVIPWVISDSQYTKSGPYRPDSSRTVFIGALHGMITAEALVTIMNDLFGNVVFAALDTDKYKYPIGSGRVAFSSHKSYMRAVTANFVDVRTPKFIKTIQIDPYLEDSLCSSCFTSPGIYFCRAFECFRYFCPACWQLWHNSTETLYTHKPLRRTFKTVTDRHLMGMAKY
ncbi:cytoplasmic polyadenylation element-binding protein [Paragonimus westermani]|uniref:Cytoplasmic polyadenylation element-binding protein n=1 Tax=Paragonimus westermani TaxID=34504 RepID=A0A5J4P2U1_9TREM|nr:cytoplasmic polyadenylation element-binding protein [Paragonimus westermani]